MSEPMFETHSRVSPEEAAAMGLPVRASTRRSDGDEGAKRTRTVEFEASDRMTNRILGGLARIGIYAREVRR